VLRETPAPLLQPIPLEGLAPLLAWLGLFCAGALGNLPGQDLLQRVFAARSARVARNACIAAGCAYLLVGAIPLFLGLASNLLLPEDAERSILPSLAGLFLQPWMAVFFVVTVMSAVLSTIDSAILAPAAVLSQNLLPRVIPSRHASLRLDEISVVGVAAASLVVAFIGENAYALLEGAYEIGLVSLLVPLLFGLRSGLGSQRSAIAAMTVGTGLWTLHAVLGWSWFAEPWLAGAGLPLPVGLTCAALAAIAYGLAARGGGR
jgi:SSS family solute:Na+ symporter